MVKIFLDMDGTATESKSRIKKDLRKLLLAHKKDIVIVSGATVEQMKKQVGEGLELMGQNGNDCKLWKNNLSIVDKREIFRFLKFLPQGNDLIQDRGSQISYSLIGHNKPLEEKKKADPFWERRREIVSQFNSSKITASIGGTTCIDFYKKGCSKGDNVLKYINAKNWNKAQCLYIGDALSEEGNDYSVMGKVSTLETKGPEQTYQLLKAIFI